MACGAAIAKCEAEGGDAAGAKRVLTLKKEGEPRTAGLMSYDEAGKTFTRSNRWT